MGPEGDRSGVVPNRMVRACARTISAWLVVLVVGAMASVQPATLSVAPAAATARIACEEPFARTELFFGSAKPDGTTVTEEDFVSFLDQEITPRFPDGLTLLVGNGQFKNGGGGIVRERSFVLILLHPRPTPASSSQIEAIRQAYKTRFAQHSVLRVDSQATQVCF